MVGRAKNTNEVEFHVLNYLLNGQAANVTDLSSLALKMHAGIKADGEPVDPVAHKRFTKGVSNIKEQLERLLQQRKRKMEAKE
jgi:50S ribosomal subunit-associated GTPase HflX